MWRFLTLQGFTRLEAGLGGRGVWFHKYFIRSKPELISRIQRVPVKNSHVNKSTESDLLSSNPKIDYSNYKLPEEKVARVIAASNEMPLPKDGILTKPKVTRPSLPLRKRSPISVEGDDNKPSPTSLGAAGMNNASVPVGTQQNSLQRLYASQEPTASMVPLAGHPTASRLPPFILTSYQPAVGATAGYPHYPQGYGPAGAFMNPPSFMPMSPSANPSQMEDLMVARQLASLGRPPAGAPLPSLSNDNANAVMARAMAKKYERRRRAVMRAQAHAQVAQVAHARAVTIGMGIPPATENIGGNDTDILAAIKQRQIFLSRLETELKAKVAARSE